MPLIKGLSILLLAILISACTQTKYNWGGYENALYQYYKNPAELEALAEELGDTIAQAEREGKIPPGLYAEFGYILLVQRKNSEAIVYFEKEKKRWPESARLMDTMLKTAKASKNKKSTSAKGGAP